MKKQLVYQDLHTVVAFGIIDSRTGDTLIKSILAHLHISRSRISTTQFKASLDSIICCLFISAARSEAKKSKAIYIQLMCS